MTGKLDQAQGLLRKALAGNALFSLFSGAIILAANSWLVKFLGLPETVSLAALGVSLLVYAALLWLNARRAQIRLGGAWAAVIMDAAWVVGSYALIFVMPFSTGGKWAVALLAELVLGFAILQWVGIRRVRRSFLVTQTSN